MAVMDYRTRDGLAEYGFSIEFQSNMGWRVYIIFEPIRQGHNDSLTLSYQCIECDGRRYVDWPSKLDSLGEAKTVAALWAEFAERYHRTQEQRKDTPAGSDHLDAAVGSGEKGAGYPDHSSAIPHLTTSAHSLSAQQEGGWSSRVENEVA